MLHILNKAWNVGKKHHLHTICGCKCPTRGIDITLCWDYYKQGFWYFARLRTREIQVFLQNLTKFPPPQKREIPRDPPEIFPNTCQQNKSYLILILAIRPVLFTPNVQIYLETSSLQRVNNIPKLPGVF